MKARIRLIALVLFLALAGVYAQKSISQTPLTAAELRSFKKEQRDARREFLKNEKQKRHEFFKENPKGEERRVYVKEYLKRLKEFDREQKEELKKFTSSRVQQ